MASLWGGRFEKDMDDIVKKYNASIFFDQRMYNEDIDGSIAHVTMLGKQGIVSNEEKSHKFLFSDTGGYLPDTGRYDFWKYGAFCPRLRFCQSDGSRCPYGYLRLLR